MSGSPRVSGVCLVGPVSVEYVWSPRVSGVCLVALGAVEYVWSPRVSGVCLVAHGAAPSGGACGRASTRSPSCENALDPANGK